jgi:hypothetical protein
VLDLERAIKAEADDLDTKTMINEILNRRAAVGLAVGVVRNGSLEFFHGHGFSDISGRCADNFHRSVRWPECVAEAGLPTAFGSTICGTRGTRWRRRQGRARES